MRLYNLPSSIPIDLNMVSRSVLSASAPIVSDDPRNPLCDFSVPSNA